MTQTQSGMQECLVAFARSVEVLHQPPKARAIEVHQCTLNVVPGWRGILATDHGHDPFKFGFMREHLGWLKIHDLRKKSRLVASREVPPVAHALLPCNRGEYDHAGSNECHLDAA